MPDKDVMVQIKQREEARPWATLAALMSAEAARAERGGTAADAGEPLIATLTTLAEDWRATADLYEKAKGKGFQTIYIVPLRHAAAELDRVIKGLEQPRRAPLGQLQQPLGQLQPHESAGLDEPVHRFEVGPGATGTVCTAMVERNGAGDQCGRYASHPAHRMQTPAIGDGTGLDALISGTIAKHQDEINSALITPLTEAHDAAVATLAAQGVAVHPAGSLATGVGQAALPGRMDDGRREARRAEERAGFPGQASSEEVTAYLSGKIDDLPGEPLQPGSVRDQTAPESPEMTPDEIAAWKRGEIDPESEAAAYLRDVVGEPGPGQWSAHGDAHAGALLSDPIRNSARQILETMPVTAAIPPVPLLGQPGNAGAGYDHAYAPPGGVPATYAELLTPVPLAVLPPHISHSQIETAGECGVKYRLQRLDRIHAGPDGAGRAAPVVQIPQWALIGGKALHAAIEGCERIWAANPNDPFDVVTADEESGRIWTEAFDAECQKIESTSPVPRSRWRTSRQGAEGESWWNANGPLMIERYLKARPAEPTAMIHGEQHGPAVEPGWAIELERTVPVPTPYGPIDYRAIIDRITVRTDPNTGETTLIIRDYKSSYSMPDSTQQLGEYAQVLRLLGVPPAVKILGTYFNARKGVWTPEVGLEEAGWTAEWFPYHVASGHAERLKLTMGPTPARPSSYCGGCPVRWACPVRNGAKAS